MMHWKGREKSRRGHQGIGVGLVILKYRVAGERIHVIRIYGQK